MGNYQRVSGVCVCVCVFVCVMIQFVCVCDDPIFIPKRLTGCHLEKRLKSESQALAPVQCSL